MIYCIEKVTIRRFIKKPDNARMTTVKVDLQERTMLETAITTQTRHDCEKLAITGLEPASQDRSS